MDCMAAVLVSTNACEVDSGGDVAWPITALRYAGYGTTAAVLGLPLINTFFRVWQMKAVGILRGEPLVASLVGYICSFFFSFLQNKCCFNDAVWISIIGMIFYSAYLGLYFMYAHNADQRETTVYCILFSVFCILFVMVPGLVANCTTVIQFMYVLAGVVSACTPLGLALFVLENTVENLPDWLSSAFGLLHYLVWGLLASYPNQDYFDITQNAAGVLCSGSLLVMLFIRQRNEAELAAGNGVGVNEAELAAGNGVGVNEAELAAGNGVGVNEAELAAGNGVGVDEAELAAGNGVGVYAPLMANQHGQV